MSARQASSVKAVRFVVAAALVVLAAALAFRFLPHRKAPAAAEGETAGSQTIDRKEGIQHREYKDGRVWADLRADRFYLGPDGRNHLEGAVEIKDYSRGEGRETRITADAVAYDAEMTRFEVSGHVRVAGDGLAFEAEALVYDKNRGLYRSEKGGAFSSDALAGKGRVVEYDENSDRVRLSGGFDLRIKPGGEPSRAAGLSGDSLTYDRAARTGVVQGRARLLNEEAEGTAERLAFALSEDERRFREASFEKAAKCVFKGGPDERQSIEAETVRIISARETSRLSRVEAEGGCLLGLAAPSGLSGTVRAPRARLEFDGQGKLAGWTAEGGVLMTVDEGTPAAREAAGETASYSGQGAVLTVSAGRGGAARLEDGGSSVEAPEVALGSESKDLRARGGVRCILKPRPGRAQVGFFSAGEAVFATADSLTTSDAGARLRFEGAARAWQGQASLQAATLEVVDATGEVAAHGGVSATLPWPSKDPADKKIVETGGREMTYSPSGRTVLFRGQGFVKAPRARLTAASVTISLVEGKAELKDLKAEDGVTVSLDRYEGRGGQAVYDPGAETLILTGAPVLVEKGRGETRGDKLTFRLADDKILIENKGQGRSTTDIKS